MSTRELALNAGVDVLSRLGLHSVNMSNIAAMCRVSRQTLHAHFGTVDDFRDAVATHAVTLRNDRALAWLRLAGHDVVR